MFSSLFSPLVVWLWPMNFPLMLAQASGNDVVRSLLVILVVGICVLLIWWAGKYFITKLGAPAIAMTVWNGIFVLLGLFFIVNFLLGLIGRPLVRF